MTSESETETGITPEQLVAKYQDLSLALSIAALDGLDDIDWHVLQHAYGEASDIPALLRATFSENARDRAFAFILLHETICHQGTVYEASIYAVPFLLKMLQSDETPDKTSVAFLLATLADGYDEDEGTNWISAIRAALAEGVHLLYPYLNDESPTVRLVIARALAFCPVRARESITILDKALDTEQDEHAKRQIQATITILNATT